MEEGTRIRCKYTSCRTGIEPGVQHGVNPMDPALGIDWKKLYKIYSGKDAEDFLISSRDLAWPMLADIEPIEHDDL